MSLFKWSTTAASNATADPSINWQEGMSPSAVNDSARAEMAAVAKYRDDIAGALLTSGSGTAYTLTSNQVFDTLAHMDGAMIAFTPHATNTGAATLNVDGLGAKSLRIVPSVAIPDGVLIEGTPYVATYNNTDGEWILHGIGGNPYNVPLGAYLISSVADPPNSAFVKPYGQAISRTTYATYFAKVSTTYGSGDGSTTFNVPDGRGRVFIMMDNMGGTAANRVTSAGGGIDGTTLGATGGAETNTLTTSEIPELDVDIPSGEGSHKHTVTHDAVKSPGGLAVGDGAFFGGGTVSAASISLANATLPAMTGTANTGTTAAAFTNMQPGIVQNAFLRVI